ncbi:hypothetical protein AB0J43_02135 [Nonomuraea fuscirosea]
MSGSRRGPEPKLGVPLGKKPFPLRLPDPLRDIVKDNAARAQMPINEYLVRKVAEMEGFDLKAPPPASAQETLLTLDETTSQSAPGAVAA